MRSLDDGVVDATVEPDLHELGDVGTKHRERSVDRDVGDALLQCSHTGLREEDVMRTPFTAGLAQAIAHDDLDALGSEVVVAEDGVHLNASSQTFADGGDEIVDSVAVIGHDQDVDRFVSQCDLRKLEL